VIGAYVGGQGVGSPAVTLLGATAMPEQPIVRRCRV